MWAINLQTLARPPDQPAIIHHLHCSSYTCRRRCVPPTSSTRAPEAVDAVTTQFTFAPWLIACSSGAPAPPPLASVDHGSEAGRTAVQSQSSTRLSLAPDASRRPVPSAKKHLDHCRHQGPSAQAVRSAHPESRAPQASQEGAPLHASPCTTPAAHAPASGPPRRTGHAMRAPAAGPAHAARRAAVPALLAPEQRQAAAGRGGRFVCAGRLARRVPVRACGAALLPRPSQPGSGMSSVGHLQHDIISACRVRLRSILSRLCGAICSAAAAKDGGLLTYLHTSRLRCFRNGCYVASHNHSDCPDQAMWMWSAIGPAITCPRRRGRQQARLRHTRRRRHRRAQQPPAARTAAARRRAPPRARAPAAG